MFYGVTVQGVQLVSPSLLVSSSVVVFEWNWGLGRRRVGMGGHMQCRRRRVEGVSRVEGSK